MSTSKTVAVIGGGLAGLAAARLLCLKGMTVKLYESNSKLGGCCATTRVGGYAFSDGAQFLAFPGMLDQLFHRLELDRNSLVPLRRIHALQKTTLPDGSVVTFGDEADIRLEGKEGATATAQKELRDFLRRWDPLLDLFADDILVHPLSLWRFLAKGWRHLHRFRGTAASSLKTSFSDDAIRSALAGTLLYAGIPPDRVPAASLLGLAAMFRQGYFIPEGGMGRIPETLGHAVREKGGEIHLNSKITRILVNAGRACGIDVEDQGVVEVDAVISIYR